MLSPFFKNFILCLPLICSFAPLKALPEPCIKGMIVTPAHVSRPLEFIVRYNGKEDRVNNDGFYTFPLTMNNTKANQSTIIMRDASKKLGLLIGNYQQEEVEDRNTLSALNPHPKKNYSYYEENADGTWVKKDFPAHAQPDTYIHVLMNPRIVESVESWDLELPASIVKMPKIIINRTTTLETLKKASFKSANGSLDTKRHHSLVGTVIAEDSKKPVMIEQKYAP